ncbi:hypothetical protein [Paenibacillus dendritiformis]|uniref:hypothetical protein n=1 Tax=Paenibacillus dendritiformis TaxID=130049 RepID=UPI00387E0C9D
MKNKHIRRINLCLQYASRKSKVSKYKHCSMLIKGNRVLSIGINREKAGCLGDPIYEQKGWHSELDCLYKMSPECIKGSVLYVAGINNNNILLSKPCIHCQRYLEKFDLKAIYYSTPYGYCKL